MLDVAVDHADQRVGFENLHGPMEVRGPDLVVGVDGQDVAAAGVPDAIVARGAEPLVGLADDRQAGSGEGVQHRAGGDVRRAVVHHDDLVEVLLRNRADAVDRLAHEVAVIEARNDEAHQGFGASRPGGRLQAQREEPHRRARLDGKPQLTREVIRTQVEGDRGFAGLGLDGLRLLLIVPPVVGRRIAQDEAGGLPRVERDLDPNERLRRQVLRGDLDEVLISRDGNEAHRGAEHLRI